MNTIEINSGRFGLPSGLIQAVIQIESGGDPWAWNPEPRYPYVVDCRTGKPFRKLTSAEVLTACPPADFPTLAGDRDQEWWGQRASWGLMQIMGAAARELGFRGRYLTQLADPVTGLLYGCTMLAKYRERFHDAYGWDGVLRAYNGGPGAVASGANQSYADKVRSAWTKLGAE